MRISWLSALLLLGLVLAACGSADGGEETVGFQDDFETQEGWRTSSDPEVEIGYQDGALGIEIKVIDRVAWSVAGRGFGNGVVSVDATRVGGPDDNAFGLVVRHVDDRNFYRFEISSDGFFAVQAPSGSLAWEFLVDWTESEAIRPGGETNRLKVACEGESMTFYVNDVEVTRVQDDRYAQGDVGVIAGTFYSEPGTHILFDNFLVEPIE